MFNLIKKSFKLIDNNSKDQSRAQILKLKTLVVINHYLPIILIFYMASKIVCIRNLVFDVLGVDYIDGFLSLLKAIFMWLATQFQQAVEFIN